MEKTKVSTDVLIKKLNRDYGIDLDLIYDMITENYNRQTALLKFIQENRENPELMKALETMLQ